MIRRQEAIDAAARARSLRFRRTALMSVPLLWTAAAWADLDPARAPGGNFALDHWSLTVPADASGGNAGPAVTIKSTQLEGADGYQSPWFLTSSNGAMTLWTPVNGATAGGSSHPRCELREQLIAGSNSGNWDQYGSSILDAQLQIVTVPGDNTVIVGQVHSKDGGPLVLLYYVYDPGIDSGRLIARIHSNPDQTLPSRTYTLAGDLELGRTFVYQIRVAQSVVSISYNSGTAVTATMNSSWASQTFYFKAGSYLHLSGTSSTEGARVRFYRLAASHPNEGLGISTSSALANAAVGTTYSVTLKAAGGAGGFVWSLVSGQPPAGLTLKSNGVLGGVPAASASSTTAHSFMASVRDKHGNTLAKKFSILVQ